MKIDPLLLRPPPRPVRLRPGRAAGVIAPTVLLPAVAAGGVGFLLWALGGLIGVTLVECFGTSVPGQVTSPVSVPYGKSRRPCVAFRYEVAGREYSAVTELLVSKHPELKEGTDVQVQVSTLMPGVRPHLLVPGVDPWAGVWPLLGGAVFTCAIAVTVAVAALAEIWRPRRLVQVGRVVVGVVESVKSHRVKGGVAYSIRYQFPLEGDRLVPDFPVGQHATMQVPENQFKEVAAGEEVVVVFDPGRPRRSVVYRFAAWEAVPSDAMP
jgi:hypothetical protein